MQPQSSGLTVTRGNNGAWRFLIVDPAGTAVTDEYMTATTEWRFRAEWGAGQSLVIAGNRPAGSTPVNAVDVPYTTVQSRAFPAGQMTSFELERRVGASQQTLVMGLIEAVGGVNDD